MDLGGERGAGRGAQVDADRLGGEERVERPELELHAAPI
jgi:hypothetical protein